MKSLSFRFAGRGRGHPRIQQPQRQRTGVSAPHEQLYTTTCHTITSHLIGSHERFLPIITVVGRGRCVCLFWWRRFLVGGIGQRAWDCGMMCRRSLRAELLEPLQQFAGGDARATWTLPPHISGHIRGVGYESVALAGGQECPPHTIRSVHSRGLSQNCTPMPPVAMLLFQL